MGSLRGAGSPYQSASQLGEAQSDHCACRAECASRYRTAVLTRYLVVALSLGACAQAESRFALPDASRSNGSHADADQGNPDAAQNPGIDAPSQVTGTHLVINEVDYDQVGTDTAEFVEIFNPTSASIDPHRRSCSSSSTARTGRCTRRSICRPSRRSPRAATSWSPTPRSASHRRATALTGWTSNAIQNGAPDGVALVDTVDRDPGRCAVLRRRDDLGRDQRHGHGIARSGHADHRWPIRTRSTARCAGRRTGKTPTTPPPTGSSARRRRRARSTRCSEQALMRVA